MTVPTAGTQDRPDGRIVFARRARLLMEDGAGVRDRTALRQGRPRDGEPAGHLRHAVQARVLRPSYRCGRSPASDGPGGVSPIDARSCPANAFPVR